LLMRQLFTPFLLLVLAVPLQSTSGQGPQRKPVLIRDERVEAKPEVFEHNPARAREFVKVGDFYNRRKNLKAAEARYRDAIRYDTTWHESYNKLITLLEKEGQIDAAIGVCYSFIDANPESKKLKSFNKKLESLKELQTGG